MSKQRFIRVEWDDSWAPKGSWHDSGRFTGEGAAKCVSVGYLVCEDKSTVTVAGHSDGGNFAGAMCIPKSAVTRRKFLKEPK